MAGGGSAYDDRVVRARLAQAFGRLIRRDGDKGMFVILSAAMPSRLLTAFPPGVMVRRIPLDQAIARVEERLSGIDLPAPALTPSRSMRTLTILRHAKASGTIRDGPDFDRPLAARGRKAAGRSGARS